MLIDAAESGPKRPKAAPKQQTNKKAPGIPKMDNAEGLLRP